MEAANAIHNRSRNRKRSRNDDETKFNYANIDTNDVADHHEQLTKSLHELCISRNLIESSSGIQKRRRVMKDLEHMLCAWTDSLLPGSPSYDDNMISPTKTDKTTSPSLLSFGSYRLGVHTPDADVDCLVLAPPHVTREDFFGSWVDVLKGEERATELHPVPRYVSRWCTIIQFYSSKCSQMLTNASLFIISSTQCIYSSDQIRNGRCQDRLNFCQSKQFQMAL